MVTHSVSRIAESTASPRARRRNPASGNPSTFMLAPGVIYEGDTYQVGLEALIPANKAAGQNVGVQLQVHFFLDDIFPNSLGKPIFN